MKKPISIFLIPENKKNHNSVCLELDNNSFSILILGKKICKDVIPFDIKLSSDKLREAIKNSFESDKVLIVFSRLYDYTISIENTYLKVSITDDDFNSEHFKYDLSEVITERIHSILKSFNQ